jgi:hypothetical protein
MFPGRLAFLSHNFILKTDRRLNITSFLKNLNVKKSTNRSKPDKERQRICNNSFCSFLGFIEILEFFVILQSGDWLNKN